MSKKMDTLIADLRQHVPTIDGVRTIPGHREAAIIDMIEVLSREVDQISAGVKVVEWKETALPKRDPDRGTALADAVRMFLAYVGALHYALPEGTNVQGRSELFNELRDALAAFEAPANVEPVVPAPPCGEKIPGRLTPLGELQTASSKAAIIRIVSTITGLDLDTTQSRVYDLIDAARIATNSGQIGSLKDLVEAALRLAGRF